PGPAPAAPSLPGYDAAGGASDLRLRAARAPRAGASHDTTLLLPLGARDLAGRPDPRVRRGSRRGHLLRVDAAARWGRKALARARHRRRGPSLAQLVQARRSHRRRRPRRYRASPAVRRPERRARGEALLERGRARAAPALLERRLTGRL